jgi:hypothetical protein
MKNKIEIILQVERDKFVIKEIRSDVPSNKLLMELRTREKNE